MSLCKDQDTFNESVYKAIKEYDKKMSNKMKDPLTIYLVVHMIFIIWALILSLKHTKSEQRIIHIMSALIFSPAYIIAYYIDIF